MRSGTDGFGEPEWLVPEPSTQNAPPVHLYSEDDDAATRAFEALVAEQRWIVQVTPLDRRMMSSEELVSELSKGDLIGHDTPVWRTGMLDWLPIGRLTALPDVALPASALTARTLPPRALDAERASEVHQRPARFQPATPALLEGALGSAGVALLTVVVTLYALSRAGVFEAGRGPRHRASSANVAAEVTGPR